MLGITLNQISKPRAKFLESFFETKIFGLSGKWLTGALLLSFSVNLLAGQEAQAISFNFTSIVNSNTIAPDSTIPFNRFDFASLNGGYVAFRGFTSSTNTDVGLYLSGNNTLTRIVNRQTLIPQGVTSTSIFTSPKDFSNQGGNIFFFSNESTADAGIYSYVGNSLQLIADKSSAIPNGSGTFAGFSFAAPQISNNIVSFIGGGPSGQQGIYQYQNQTLSRAINTTYSIPSGTGNFTSFTTFDSNGSNLAFIGNGTNSQSGIYTSIGGVLSKIADKQTPMLGGTGNFSSFGNVVIDGSNNTFFTAYDASGLAGLYSSSGGSLNLLVDTAALGLSYFGKFSASNGNVAFLGYDHNGLAGIYTNLGGSVRQVVRVGDLFNGKSISTLSFSDSALEGDSLAFTVRFSDASSAVYLAQAQYLTPLSLASAQPFLNVASLSVASAPTSLSVASLSVASQPVPEPLTLVGAATAIGFGTFFKSKINKNPKK